MLTQTVTYTDFNNKVQTDTLHFHLTRVEAAELLPDLKNLRTLIDAIEKPGSDLDEEQTLKLLTFFKKLIDLSYGVRSEDGRRFSKDAMILADFKETPAYDEFIFGLFKRPDEGNKFMEELIPDIDLESTPTETASLPNVVKKQPKDMDREELLEEFRKRGLPQPGSQE